MKVPTIAVLFVGLLVATPSPQLSAAGWLDEVFDAYQVGPLDGQGDWAANTDGIAVVSTPSLAGQAVCCDADESPLVPAAFLAECPIAVPDSGGHVLSFAVRVERPTEPFGDRLASLIFASDPTMAIELNISPVTAALSIRNDFVDTYWIAIWDLGTVPGGNPDLTTGTYHVFELDIDFGTPGDAMDDFVRDVRLDGKSQAAHFSNEMPAYLWLARPIDRLILINGTVVEGSTPDAVYFDNVIGRAGALRVRHWHLY